jgi:Family of unknown function (DUF6152)
MKHIISFDRKRVLFFLLASLACFSFTVLHHGWANYDQTKKMEVTGTIIDPRYENPHGMMKLKVDGKTWTVVLAPPSRMESRGLTQKILTEAKTATVIGYPHKTVKDEMRAERIIIDKVTTELR